MIDLRIDLEREATKRAVRVSASTKDSAGVARRTAFLVLDGNPSEEQIGAAIGSLAIFLAKGKTAPGTVHELAAPSVAYDIAGLKVAPE